MKGSIIKVLLIACLSMAGCATYGHRTFTTDIFNKYHVVKNGLSMRFEPVIDKEKSTWYLNLSPAKYDLLPVFLSIENESGHIKRINIDGVYLMAKLEQIKYASLPIETAVKTIQSSGWIPSLLFGAVGSFAAGSVEESKDEDIYHKAFRPRIIEPGGRGQGLLFFKVPKDDILNKEFALCLIIDNLDNNSTEEEWLSFETR